MTARDTSAAAVDEVVADLRWQASDEGVVRLLRTAWDHETAARSLASSLAAAVDLIDALAADLARVTAERDAAVARANYWTRVAEVMTPAFAMAEIRRGEWAPWISAAPTDEVPE